MKNGKVKIMITSYAFTDAGGRKVNEDSCTILEKDNYYCFVLCDGLGGHGKGEVASELVVDVFKSCFNDGISSPEKFIPETLMIAQNMLLSEQAAQNAPNDLKTTATVVFIDEKSQKVYRGHVGDSRIYTFSKNKVKERTLDHSVPQMLVLTREIKEKEIRNHPDRNRLLRVMGIEWERPQYQMEDVIELKKCQAFLLCSDGFWELIEEKEMCSILKKSKSVREWIHLMAEVVLENGKGKNMDNNTAIGIWVEK